MRRKIQWIPKSNPLDSKTKPIGFQNQTHWVSKPNPLDFKIKSIGFCERLGAYWASKRAALSQPSAYNGQQSASIRERGGAWAEVEVWGEVGDRWVMWWMWGVAVSMAGGGVYQTTGRCPRTPRSGVGGGGSFGAQVLGVRGVEGGKRCSKGLQIRRYSPF